MAEMTNLGFRDSPIVASELVKFLALNTEFEIIETLVKSNVTLKAEVAALTKAVAGNTKSIATATNKVDNFKITIDNINKRLAKLETKKLSTRQVEISAHQSLQSFGTGGDLNPTPVSASLVTCEDPKIKSYSFSKSPSSDIKY